MEEERIFDKKTLKKDAGRMGWSLIVYMLVVYGAVIVGSIFQAIVLGIQAAEQQITESQMNEAIERAGESAMFMIVGVVLGIVLLAFMMNKRVTIKSMFEKQKTMTIKRFLQFLSVFMAVQLVMSIFSGILELILNAYNYTAMPSIEAAQSSSTTISMFLYASFIAPITEEIVYRGFVMGALKKHGKMLAIVVSALLFGVMHGNIPQAIFAFFVGLVLGFVAMEYSVKWAILIHMLNNFVFAEVPHLCGMLFGEMVRVVLNAVIVYGFFIAGFVVLIVKRKKVKNYIAEHKGDKKLYLYVLTTVPVLIFLLINLWIGISQIQQLPSYWGSMV